MTDSELLCQTEDALRAIFLRAAVVLEINDLRTYGRVQLLGVLEEIRDLAWVSLGPPASAREKEGPSAPQESRPNCGAEHYEAIPSGEDYQIRCLGCGYVWLEPL